jgi:hypothetical protein
MDVGQPVVPKRNIFYTAVLCGFLFCSGLMAQDQPQSSTASPAASSVPATASTAPGQTTPVEPVSAELFYWFTNSQPNLSAGAANTSTTAASLNFTGDGHRSPGVVISIPAGRGNSLRVSYFQANGTGNQTAPSDLTLFSTAFSAGDYLATQYKLQNAKISYDFLSYPTPLGDSSWRFRTLWEIQYTTIQSRVDAPFRPVSTDASGNPISNTANGTRWFFYPTLGAAVDKKLTPHFRVEAKGTGFGLPHRADIWDAEGSAIYSFPRVDVVGAYRGFHFKTSPKSDQYLAMTLAGAYVGLRWNFR